MMLRQAMFPSSLSKRPCLHQEIDPASGLIALKI
jgi:hypothetical protein